MFFRCLLPSIGFFGFLGGITGVMMGSEQLNMIFTTRFMCLGTSMQPWLSLHR